MILKSESMILLMAIRLRSSRISAMQLSSALDSLRMERKS